MMIMPTTAPLPSIVCSRTVISWRLTYLCPSLPVEHRPSTTPRHPILFWAALVIPPVSFWSLAVSALLQCLASNCCEAGLSFSFPVGSRSGLGVWCWMLASGGCVRSSPTSSAVPAWPLVPVPLAPTDLHFVFSPNILEDYTENNIHIPAQQSSNPMSGSG